ncbi:MAG: hypothetical protein FJ122_07870 [Deltaproteobacteria bacterium]|nr:hypothetical protein [Deltaproteobacteria bacterium]
MPIKPTEHEDEYFARLEREMKEKIKEQMSKQAPKEERESLRKLHFMKCPKCGMDLMEIDFKGMRIDECSTCRGIWLDAGEFDAMAKMDKPVLQRLFNVFKN